MVLRATASGVASDSRRRLSARAPCERPPPWDVTSVTLHVSRDWAADLSGFIGGASRALTLSVAVQAGGSDPAVEAAVDGVPAEGGAAVFSRPREFLHGTRVASSTCPPLKLPTLGAGRWASRPTKIFARVRLHTCNPTPSPKVGALFLTLTTFAAECTHHLDEEHSFATHGVHALLAHHAVFFETPPADELSRARAELHAYTQGTGSAAAFLVSLLTSAGRCAAASAPLPDPYLGGSFLRHASNSHEQQVIVQVTASESPRNPFSITFAAMGPPSTVCIVTRNPSPTIRI